MDSAVLREYLARQQPDAKYRDDFPMDMSTSPSRTSTDLATRLHVEEDLQQGEPVPLSSDRAHFLGRVLRLAPGAELALFNGRDGEWRAEITAISKRDASVTPTVLERPQPVLSSALTLIIPPIKKNRADWLIEKATELGVTAIQPVLSEHTSVRDVKLDRWRKITVEAAEQCERLDLPEILPLTPLATVLKNWDSADRLLIAAERGTTVPLRQATLPAGNLALLIGPEGGFSSTELDLFTELPFADRISLGPRILRAETAALSALAIVQNLRQSET